jgi:hypothetical protein
MRSQAFALFREIGGRHLVGAFQKRAVSARDAICDFSPSLPPGRGFHAPERCFVVSYRNETGCVVERCHPLTEVGVFAAEALLSAIQERLSFGCQEGSEIGSLGNRYTHAGIEGTI